MEKSMINKVAEILGESKRMVVLSGAGISTESGIKDFRSSKGLYQIVPERVLSIDYFYDHPKEFYEFAFEYLFHPDAKPNAGHKIIAKWEEQGRVKDVITQNIDELHQKAGSKHVIEFHGTMKTATCMNCGQKYSTEHMVERMKSSQDFYVCHHCETYREKDHYIKPDIVLFGDAGEWFTQEGFEIITNKISQADCLLALGSSLRVTPFSNFPQFRKKGIPLIIINKGTTPYDHTKNTYVIQESIGETLEQLDALLPE